MSTAYATMHTEKGTGSGGGLGNHVDRKEEKKHTYEKHIDQTRTHLNKDYLESKLTVPQAIAKRIAEGYTSRTAKGELKKIRPDAKRFLTTVLTGSHLRMKEIFENKELSQRWIQKNADFMRAEYGIENIVRFTLHLDEKTPHIHCIHVPLTTLEKEEAVQKYSKKPPKGTPAERVGRLSAKVVMGNRNVLSARQDRYAAAMKEFGLERGIKGTGIKHENANDYYKRLEKEKILKAEMMQKIDSAAFLSKSPIQQNKMYKEFFKATSTAQISEISNREEKERSRKRGIRTGKI